MLTLDIVLPCYNPLPNWEKRVIETIPKLRKNFPQLDLKLIIVNDGSAYTLGDSLDQITEHIPAFEYIDNSENRGKGHAIRKGVKEGTGNYVLFTDVDFPYTISSMTDMINLILQNRHDVIFATRKSTYYRQVPLIRKVISKSLKFLVKHVLRVPFTDTQGGLKAFNRRGKEVLLETKTKGYLFDLELLKLAQRKELNIGQVNCLLRDDVRFTQMPLRILLREAVNFSKIVFR